nr:protein kinase [Paenibacillus turpanensis]
MFREGRLIRGIYRVERVLGEGSYGAAALCIDERNGRRCVLKWIAPEHGSPQKARRVYERETGLLRRLRHPAIPALYDTFAAWGFLCFTMQVAEGKSIEELLFADGIIFSERQALELCAKLLPVLAYLHQASVIHRDISIANVMVQRGEPMLIDFGLARVTGNSAEEVTADDIDLRDPSVKKERRRIHPTSDFYSLGHLLLFLLYSDFDEPEDEVDDVEGVIAKEQSSAGTQPFQAGVDSVQLDVLRVPEDEEEMDRGWEEELSLAESTKKLLRRLLRADQPFETVEEAARAFQDALQQLPPDKASKGPKQKKAAIGGP